MATIRNKNTTKNTANTAFLELVKKRTGAKTIAELARKLGKDYLYVYSILRGRQVSRKLVLKIAELYHIPDLLYFYEKFLQERVENKPIKSTKNLHKKSKEV